MTREHKIWAHAAKSVRHMFLGILVGLLLIELATRYVDIGFWSLLGLSTVVVVPSMVAVRLAHSEAPDLYYLPALVIFVTGSLVVAILAMGCDVEWFSSNCYGGFAGPVSVLGLMFSWAGVTWAFGYGSHKHMLRHGRVK